MPNSCIRIRCDSGDKDSVDSCCNEVLRVLNDDGIWVMPTDTIYGISGNGLSEVVHKKIEQVKKRREKSFIMLVRDFTVAQKYGKFSDKIPTDIVELFVSGNITLIVPSLLSIFGKSVALRTASTPLIKKILDQCDYPVISTSANISGDKYVDSPDYIYDTFKRDINLMIDFGSSVNNEPSTIIEFISSVKVIRKGKYYGRIEKFVA